MKSDRIKNWPARERPRERLIAEGPERLTDVELLAIVLRVGRGTFKAGVSGQSATELARQLLTDFKGWRGLDRAFTQDLIKVPGLSKAKVAQVKATLETGKRLHTKRLTSISFESSGAVAAHLRPRFLNARHETVYVVLLDGENRHLDTRLIAEGTPTEATVYIRRVLEEALKASAAAIVIVHNHPSGDPLAMAGDRLRDPRRGVVIPVVAGAVTKTKKDTAYLFEPADQVRVFHPTTSSPMRWTAGMLPLTSSA